MGEIPFSVADGRMSMATIQPRAKKTPKSNGDTIHPDSIEDVTAALLTEINVLQAVMASLQDDLDECHAMLDAADVPEADTIRDRLVWVAKEWFRHHPIGCQDHISPKFRKLLSEAGEGAWMTSKP